MYKKTQSAQDWTGFQIQPVHWTEKVASKTLCTRLDRYEKEPDAQDWISMGRHSMHKTGQM